MKTAQDRVLLKKDKRLHFTKNSPELMLLSEKLNQQDHLTVVLWAFRCLEAALTVLNQSYPQDQRAKLCVEKSMQWARGQIKMPEARQYILALHAMAKEVESARDRALCHGVAQACSSVHTERHAIGLPLYELSALLLEHGENMAGAMIRERIRDYEKTLEEVALAEKPCPWAAFLLRELKPKAK